MFRRRRFDVPWRLLFMGLRRDVQIGDNDRERTLHIIHHVAPARIDVADENPPAAVSAGTGGFPPEAKNENLIQERLL